MNNYYFTFGTHEAYPYGREDFIMITAEDMEEAAKLFQARHPNRPGSTCYNCASIYEEEEFNSFRDKYYKGRLPVEKIEVTVNEN